MGSARKLGLKNVNFGYVHRKDANLTLRMTQLTSTKLKYSVNMDNGVPQAPKIMTYSNCRIPIIGALIDYMDTSMEFFWQRTFVRAEKLHVRASKVRLSASFMAVLCLMVGFVTNIKLEVVTFDEKPLSKDLHFMLMSKEDNLYIDDIDVSRMLWCIEASDLLVLLISCLLVWNSSNVRSPLSEYLFLPWLGVTLRGMFLRQVPTVSALVYTMIMVEGSVSPLFLTAFTFLFLVESRLCLEITRMVRARWEHHVLTPGVEDSTRYEVETLWSNDDVRSVEVRNYFY